MAKSAFDFSDLFNQIEREVSEVMTSPASQKALKEHAAYAAFEYVYPYYSPTKYERRYAGGGLGSPENYEVIPAELKLTLINNTPGNGSQPGEAWTSGPINDIIEGGTGYGWRHSDIYQMQPYPRPFMQKAIDEYTEEYLLPEIHERVFK